MSSPKAHRDLSDTLLALQGLGFSHAAVAKPLRIFARHAATAKETAPEGRFFGPCRPSGATLSRA
ncbi:protein of unknown function [Shinella sp. WSC3-e]|nr:hypothetical protein SHINE37_43746 [Rhizobiaceae bacterium]CAK7258274.1 protein of unknown function [Shinella sp. WSC3-e]